MSSPHDKRSAPRKHIAGTDVSPDVSESREQADGAATRHEREVPVTAGSELPRDATPTTQSTGTAPTTSPITAPGAPPRASRQSSMAGRLEAASGQWGEQVGSTMASARRIARDRARRLTAPERTGSQEVGGRHSAEAAQPANAAERWPDSPNLQRAEIVVSRMSGRMRPLASVIGQRVRRLMARAREEAEDIWAEAESMRARGARRSEQDQRTPPG